jgi:hypothetical protein
MSVAAKIQRSTVRGCHLNFAVVNRFDKRGHATALKAAAYNGCTRISAFGHRFDFTRKSAEHRGHYVFVPENVGRQEWLMDPAKTWTRATELERQANGQVARQIQFSLPRELAESEYKDFIQRTLKRYTDAGMVAHVDVHITSASDGGLNPHVHAMLSMRELTADGSDFAKTKTGRAREWNAMFRAQNGRVERLAIEAAANEYLAAHGYAVRVDMGRNEDPDDPPEPHVSREEIELAKRARDSPADRPSRVKMRDVIRKRRGEAMKYQQKKTAYRNYKPWTEHRGGYDALPPKMKAAASRSHARWIEAEKGSLGLQSYVSYVQERRAEELQRIRKQQKAPRKAQEDGLVQAQAHVEDERFYDEQFEPIAEGDSDPSDVDPDAGMSPHMRHMLRLLARHYGTEDLEASDVANMKNVHLNPAEGVATVRLNDGTSFRDSGDHIRASGPPQSDALFEEVAKAAERHGWQKTKIIGSKEFRRRAAFALSLRNPPMEHNYKFTSKELLELEEMRKARQGAGISSDGPAKQQDNSLSSDSPVQDEKADIESLHASYVADEYSALSVAGDDLAKDDNAMDAVREAMFADISDADKVLASMRNSPEMQAIAAEHGFAAAIAAYVKRPDVQAQDVDFLPPEMRQQIKKRGEELFAKVQKARPICPTRQELRSKFKDEHMSALSGAKREAEEAKKKAAKKPGLFAGKEAKAEHEAAQKALNEARKKLTELQQPDMLKKVERRADAEFERLQARQKQHLQAYKQQGDRAEEELKKLWKFREMLGEGSPELLMKARFEGWRTAAEPENLQLAAEAQDRRNRRNPGFIDPSVGFDDFRKRSAIEAKAENDNRPSENDNRPEDSQSEPAKPGI